MNINKKEKYEFQSETKQLLNLMIHSLYSNKEIFIRELISNASDAIDKMRFKLLSQKINNKNYKMRIRIIINKEERKIIISDNGIGMKKDEIINNLGVIASSGTRRFLESLPNNNINNNQLIGKFGVGFYSAFIVSDKVIVKTKHIDEINENNGIMWESSGKGNYFIKKINKIKNGTDVELYLKKEENQFLEEWKLREIINKYSDHISIPIEIQEYDKIKKNQSWKQINKAKALWTLNKSEIKEHEYKEFYQNITKDINEPLTWIHNKVEGIHEYISLLYIPRKLTWNILDQENKKNGLKLYVKKIYIMDDANQFLPNYLRFIKGILDTDNLPLNISREILQENHITTVLKTSLTKKVLKLIHLLSLEKNEKYKIFWKEFGLIFKEGIVEDIKNQERIASLLRFTSIKNNSKEQTLSLDQYINNMHEKQNKIYFLIADNYNTAITSPHLEIFYKNNIDVLLLSDKIDDWMMNYLIEFKGKKFQSINKIDQNSENLFNNSNKNIIITPEIEKFLNKIKTILKEKVQSVQLSTRLIKSPTILIADKNNISPQMSKLFIAAGQKIPPTKYTFEININHPLIIKIMNIQDDTINDWIHMLFNQALLSEHGTLENPNDFIKIINKLLIKY